MARSFNPGNAGQPSIMSHDFGRVQAPRVQRSTFKRPCKWRGDIATGETNEAYLYPWFVDEIYPGETCNLSAGVVARMATPLFPVMGNIQVRLDWFFAPWRLLWNNWERFQGYRPTPTSTVDFELPSLAHSAGTPTADLIFALHSVFDVMGLPCLVNIPVEHAPVVGPMRAYRRIWNEQYRAQDVQDEIAVPLDDGPDYIAEHETLLQRNKRPDYFGSCLLSPQKGDPVQLPLGDSAPVSVYGTGRSLGLNDGTGTSVGNFSMMTVNTSQPIGFATGVFDSLVGSSATAGTAPAANNSIGVVTDPATSGLTGVADLTEAVAATLEDFRFAIVTQHIRELDSRGGTRYIESLMTRWGVDGEDYRLQRTEFLGSSVHEVNMHAVPQTSQSDVTSQGNLAAFALASGRKPSEFVKTFKEHGYIIGIMSITADQEYQQGMRRMWSRRTRQDMYEPLMNNLGEQAVLNKELVMLDDGNEGEVFGYQEHWSELRAGWSVMTGHMRSVSPVSLDAWHLALDHQTTPTLEDFLKDAPPFTRVQSVVQVDPPVGQWNIDLYAENLHARPMGVNSIPGLSRL